MRLQAVSRPAIEKPPSVVDWIGSDLARIATGVLQEMLDDCVLQASIARGEIACLPSTTASVLRIAEHPRIGKYDTTVSHFFHDGTLYSGAVSAPARADAILRLSRCAHR